MICVFDDCTKTFEFDAPEYWFKNNIDALALCVGG